jgi:hypothetical protein
MNNDENRFLRTPQGWIQQRKKARIDDITGEEEEYWEDIESDDDETQFFDNAHEAKENVKEKKSLLDWLTGK